MAEVTQTTSHSAEKRSFLKLSLIFFGMAIVVFVLWRVSPTIDQGPLFFTAYVIILLAILGLQFLMVKHLRSTVAEENPWLVPPSLIVVWTLISFGLPGLVGFFQTEWLTPAQRLVGVDYQYFIIGWFLIALSCLLLWGGYLLGIRFIRPIGLLSNLAQRSPSLIVTMTVYALIVMTRLTRLSTMGISYGTDRLGLGLFASFAQVLNYFGSASLLILAIVCYQVFKGQWPRVVFLAVLIFELAASFSSGFSKPVLEIIVIILVIAIYCGVNRRRMLMYGLALVLLGLLAVPVSRGLRSNFGSFDSTSPLAVISATRSAVSSSLQQNVDGTLDFTLEKVLTRNSGVAHHPGIIIRKTPSEVQYLGWDRLVLLPAYLLPRFIWEDKPILSQGVWFSVTYMNRSTGTSNSGGMTIYGESYMYAGWLSSVLLMLLFGLLLSFVSQNTIHIGLIALYAALIPQFADIDSGITTKFIGVVQTFAVYLLLSLLIYGFPQKMFSSDDDAPDEVGVTT